MVSWLNDAVFYEIYPQTYYDTNGDGIGDIPGIIAKLDYIKSLGCNALWLNPLFDSPFKDAGYDVRDYQKVAPRYGTNEDLVRLFFEAHARNMHVILDLVPGHTSEEHAWFQESSKAEENEYTSRYIWTDHWIKGIKDHIYIGGESPRNGVYMLNFFKCQPALNYGFRIATQRWQDGINDPAPLATREAMKDVIRFWLSKGADGFRVDMADSLVKDDDENKSGTCEVWRDILGSVREDYPEAAFVSEWSNPSQALSSAGFDMDFYLDHPGNGYNTLVRDWEEAIWNKRNDDSGSLDRDHSFFKKDSGGDIRRFLGDYLAKYELTKGDGYISFLTCNHDTPRMSATLSPAEQRLAMATILTLPGVPFLYYGDEIGMRYQWDLPSKEGGYTRTGSRTPMQWNNTRNKGFSSADEDQIYLPVDGSEDAPTVEDQEKDPDSMLEITRKILALRHLEPSMQADGDFEVLYARKKEFPFVYRRGNVVCAVNPSSETVGVEGDELEGNGEILLCIGEGSVDEAKLVLGPQSFIAWRRG